MRNLLENQRAVIEQFDAERQAQEDFLRLAGVPDDLAKAALGLHATYKGRFSEHDLLRAITNLARQGAFVERRWAKRIKLLEQRLDFARQAIDGARDDEPDELALNAAKAINEGTFPGVTGTATARAVGPGTVEVRNAVVGTVRAEDDDDGA